MTYHYFRRGSVTYWSTDLAVVRSAHAAALDAQRRAFAAPSPINSTAKHPSHLGPAWQLTPGQSMG